MGARPDLGLQHLYDPLDGLCTVDWLHWGKSRTFFYATQEAPSLQRLFDYKMNHLMWNHALLRAMNLLSGSV